MMITHFNSQLPTSLLPLSNGVFNELNRFVNEALAPEVGEPVLDDTRSEIESISNDQEGWKIRLELPGFKKEEVKLTVDDDFLHIAAEATDEERSFLGKDERRIRISDEVDADTISAKLEDGILYLEIARRAKPEPKVIALN